MKLIRVLRFSSSTGVDSILIDASLLRVEFNLWTVPELPCCATVVSWKTLSLVS